MSKERPDLDNSVPAIRQYVEWLGKLPMITKVLLVGSRSPLRKKKVTATSDWDLVIVHNSASRLGLPNPQKQFGVNVDMSTSKEEYAYYHSKGTEIWPNDEHGILR